MASPAMARDLTGRRLGRYEVLAQLAAGGMATVYVARAQGVAGFERLVAVKVLHPHLAHDDEFISMFLDEARLAARIRHPNVVPTLDISDSQGDGYFLVMEYIEGDHFGSLLREAARAGKNLPPGVALRVVVDALEGLGAAHQLADGDGKPLGIVHRDISPHNILVGSDGIARITDFGVAKAEVRLSSTRDGQFKGKLAYMAPEQASTGFADQRSDLFGMGVVLWESLVGRRLFKAENNGELLNRLLYAEIPKVSDYAPELAPLDAVLAKALERDPADRFQSAPEFIDAIEAAASAVGGIGNQRTVGRSVKELLGTKIDTEGTRIRTAIDSLGRSEVSSAGSVPRPEPSGVLSLPYPGARPGSSSQPSQVRRAAPEDMTVGAKPTTRPATDEQESARPRSHIPMLVGVGVVIVLALGAGWYVFSRDAALTPAVAEPPVAGPIAAPDHEATSTAGSTGAAAAPTPGSTSLGAGAGDTAAGAASPGMGAPAAADVNDAPTGTEAGGNEPRAGHRRRPGSTSMATPVVTPPTGSSTTMAPAVEDDVIPSPYQ